MKKLARLVMLTAMILFVCSCGNNSGQKENNNKSNQFYYNETDYGETDTGGEIDNEVTFSYRLLGKDYSSYSNSYGRIDMTNYVIYTKEYDLDGLIVCLNGKPVFFDDEEDYYNSYIYEWALALKIGEKLSSWGGVTTRYDFDIVEGTRKTFRRVLSDGDTIDISKTNLYCLNFEKDTIYTIVKTNNIFGTQIEEQVIDRNGNAIKNGDTLLLVEKKINLQDIQYYLSSCVHCLPDCVKDKYGYDYVELFRIDGEEYHDVPNGALGIRFKNMSSW